MSDIKDFINIANLYNAVLFERDLSNFNDAYLQRAAEGTGRSMVSPEEAKAELAKRAAQTSVGTPPEVQTTAPEAPVAPKDDNAPGIGAESIPVTGNRDEDPAVSRTAPAGPAAVDAAAGVTPPAGPAQTGATTTAPGVDTTDDARAARTGANTADPGVASGPTTRPNNAPAQTGANTADPGVDTTDDARAARTNAAEPATGTTSAAGLPAKLGQIQTSNLMKDYNAGGKQEMESVKQVQTALSRLGFDPNGLDGKYGPGTFKAVQEFQKANGLKVDGQVGPNTLKAMMDKLNSSAPAAPAAPAAAPVQSGAGDEAEAQAAIADRERAAAAGNGAGDEAEAQAAIADREVATDSARVEELIAKLDVAPTQQNASTDFGHLIAIVEGHILKEALSQDEVKELEDIVAKYKDNPKFNRELLSRAEAAIAASGPQTGSGAPTPSRTATTPDNTVAPVSAAPTTGSGNPTPANANAGKPVPDAEVNPYEVGGGLDKTAPPKISKELGMQWAKDQGRDAGLVNFNLKQFKAHGYYIDLPMKDGSVTRAYGKQENLQNFIDTDRRGKGLEIKSIKQNSSKEYNMKNSVNEASMNISMNGNDANEVAELVKILQNAGMPSASPVKDIMPPMAPKGDMADFMGMVDSGMQGPAEPCSVCGEVHEETSCSEDTSEYDAIIDEWDNTPEEEFSDHHTMTQDLSGGLNRPKKAYAAAQDGDNAMAVEAIKSDLRKALEEALKGK